MSSLQVAICKNHDTIALAEVDLRDAAMKH